MKQRIAFYGLAIALATAIAGLAATLYRLSAVKAERTQLRAWQAQILGQLGSAVGSSSLYDRSRPLPAADASEALADIIGARNDALKALVMPGPYQIRAPANPEAGPEGGMPGRAPPPREIAQFLNRPGSAGRDVQAIDQDSQTPWKGWE